jgi:hypothetical protein
MSSIGSSSVRLVEISPGPSLSWDFPGFEGTGTPIIVFEKEAGVIARPFEDLGCNGQPPSPT